MQTPDSPARRAAILAVDDEPQVLRAVDGDLRRRYGERFRILRSGDGPAALQTLRQLVLREEEVALIVADQRMPQVSGVELLAEAKQLHPNVRTVLLTGYADTDAAIRGINEIRLDHYIQKPWEPPEERFYPVLDELLDDWVADKPPPFEGLRLVGHRWSADAHRLREFLARNQVPFRWLDVELDADEAGRILNASAGDPTLPLVVLEDGRVLATPTPEAVAEAIGLIVRSSTPFYDLAVIGGGPAGLAAAVYGASEGLQTVLLERVAPGGQAGASARIENYLGFPAGLSGADLARRGLAQARRFGAEVISPTEVCSITVRDPYRVLRLIDGSELAAAAVIVVTGVSYRRLEVPGADELTGVGVYYGGSLAEAHSFEGEDVAIVGGANSAGQAAVYFARFAGKVTLLVRGSDVEATMSSYLVKQIRELANVDVRTCCSVASVQGDGHLERVELVHGDGRTELLEVSGLFVYIGAEPHTDWLADVVSRDERGFVLTGPQVADGKAWHEERAPLLLETDLPGVFAAGDVRSRSVKRVASAVGEGAIAVQLVHEYLRI